MLAALGALVLAVPAGRAQPRQPIDALLARFAAMPGLWARFREEKRIGLLAAPLVSEGTLHFAPPGRLARVTTRPERVAVRVAGERLVVEQAGRSETIDLQRHAAVRSFVDGLRRLLAGDRRGLERTFRLALRMHPDDRWELTLVPRDAAVARVIRDLRVRARGVVLERLFVHETSGDVSDTTFTEVNPAYRYSARDLTRLFPR